MVKEPDASFVTACFTSAKVLSSHPQRGSEGRGAPLVLCDTSRLGCRAGETLPSRRGELKAVSRKPPLAQGCVRMDGSYSVYSKKELTKRRVLGTFKYFGSQ